MFDMSSTMVEPPINLPSSSSSHRALSKMPSTTTLNSPSPAGARPKLSRSATVASKPSPKSARTSPGRGLTLRIEDNMHELSLQSIRSAPAKAIRRLPPVPAPMPPLSESMSIVPHTAPVDHDSETTKTFRQPRPLPCPPTIPTTPHVTPIEPSSSGHQPTTPCSPTRKPLPVPQPKLVGQIPREEARVLHRQTLPNLPRRTATPPPVPPVPPLPTAANTNPRKNLNNYSQNIDQDEPKSPVSDVDVEEAVIQLGNRIVLRKASTISLRLDPISDDDEEKAPPVPPLPLLIPDVISTSKDPEEKEDHVDYAWVLSNRTLYRQQSPQYQSKWVREKKGKRYTEEDFENIIQALRSL